MTLNSQVEVRFAGPDAASITAAHGTITKDPRVVVLETIHAQQGAQRAAADSATLFLTRDNTLDRMLAAGNVRVQLAGKQPTHIRADQLELLLDDEGNNLRTATFSGNVDLENSGGSPVRGSAGRVIASFVGDSVLSKVHAEENVRLLAAAATRNPAGPRANCRIDYQRYGFLRGGR